MNEVTNNEMVFKKWNDCFGLGNGWMHLILGEENKHTTGYDCTAIDANGTTNRPASSARNFFATILRHDSG